MIQLSEYYKITIIMHWYEIDKYKQTKFYTINFFGKNLRKDSLKEPKKKKTKL